MEIRGVCGLAERASAGSRSASRLRDRRTSGAATGSWLSGSTTRKREPRPGSLVDLDAPAVGADEVRDEREPDARPVGHAPARLRRRARSGRRSRGEMLGRDADAGVGDLDDRLAVADREPTATRPPASV